MRGGETPKGTSMKLALFARYPHLRVNPFFDYTSQLKGRTVASRHRAHAILKSLPNRRLNAGQPSIQGRPSYSHWA